MLEERDYQRRPAAGPVQEGPSLVVILVLVNLGALVLRQLFSAHVETPAGAISVKLLQDGEWWTVFTHGFIHQGWGHLIVNMMMLLLAGRRVLADAGPRHFLYIYLVSGWVAAAATLLLHPQDILIGASGCVMGVIGAYAALHPDRSVTERLGAWIPRLKAKNLFLGMLTAEIVLECVATATQHNWNIPLIHRTGHAAHAAGLLAGWMYARHLAPALEGFYHREEFFPQGRRRRRQSTVEQPPVPVRSALARQAASFSPEPVFAEAPPPPLSNDEFLRQAVDPVLDKLYTGGMASLTEAERRILDEAANRFSQRRE